MCHQKTHLHTEKMRRKAWRILATSSHLLSNQFEFLKWGRRYRVPVATSLLKKSFIPNAIGILNSAKWPMLHCSVFYLSVSLSVCLCICLFICLSTIFYHMTSYCCYVRSVAFCLLCWWAGDNFPKGQWTDAWQILV